MSVSDCCWHWQDTVLAADCQRVIYAYTSNASVYNVSSCDLFCVEFYHYFCHLVPYTATRCGRLHSLNLPLPLSTFGADVLCGWPLNVCPMNRWQIVFSRPSHSTTSCRSVGDRRRQVLPLSESVQYRHFTAGSFHCHGKPFVLFVRNWTMHQRTDKSEILWVLLECYGFCNSVIVLISVLWHCWLGDRKGIRPVKSWVLVCWSWRFDWRFACLVAPVVTSTVVTSIKSRMETFWYRLTKVVLENGW